MKKVINLKNWQRARLGMDDNMPRNRRARSTRPEGGPGFVTIGAISAEIIRKMRQE